MQRLHRFSLAGALMSAVSIAPSQQPRAQPEWPPLSAVLEIRLGEDRGPLYEFERISTMAIGPRGEFAVKRASDLRIDVFDSTGARIAHMGRDGAGPGEFRSIYRIFWVRDTIVAFDPELVRMSMFTSTGRVAGTFPANLTPTTPGYRLFVDGVPLDNGSLIGDLVPLSRDERGRTIARIDRTGRDLGIVAHLAPDGSLDVPQPPGGPFIAQPFRDGPIWSGYGNGAGVAVVDRKPAPDATFRVRSIASDGSVRFDRSYRYAPVPISRGAADSIARAFIERRAAGGGTRLAGAQEASVRTAPWLGVTDRRKARAYIPGF